MNGVDTSNDGVGLVLAPQDESLTVIMVGVFQVSWKHRWKIILTVIIVTTLAVLVSFLVPNKYVAETTILPDLDMMDLASKLGSLQEMASAAGLTSGTTSPSQLDPDILSSETILRKVIYHRYKTHRYDSTVNLIQYWKLNEPDENLNFENCLEKLQTKVLSISVDKKTAILTMDVETDDPQLSADIANQTTVLLDDFQRNFRKTNASEQRKFIEQRMKEVQEDLARSEEALKNFREKNRRVDQSPQLTLEEGRLERDGDLNSAIFIELKKQFELAKLSEIRNTPIVQVLDAARPPAKKSSPHRSMILVLAALVSFLFSSTYWYIAEYLRKHRNQPEVARMAVLWNTLRLNSRATK